MRILFLTTILLSKNANGGEVASQYCIDSLRKLGCIVDIIGYHRKGDVFEQDSEHTIVVDHRYTETSKAGLYLFLWLGMAILKQLPYSAAKYYSNQYIKSINSVLSNHCYDAIVIDHAQVGWLLNFLPKASKHKTIFIAHNIEHAVYKNYASKARNPIAKWIYSLEANRIKQLENQLIQAAQEIWTLTSHDAHYFSHTQPLGNVRALNLPSPSSQSPEQPVTKAFDVGLLGSWSWQANQESLQWFLQTIYPHLPLYLSIHVAGKGADWLRGKYPNIHYQGVVPDAVKFMAQARVFAIPTLQGGGIQIKTLDAIASGTTIVATPIALRGISNPPKTVRVATNAEEFAEQLIESIDSEVQQQAFDEARIWCQARQQSFVSEISSALSALASTSR